MPLSKNNTTPSILDALSDGVITCDQNGYISFANPAAQTLLGLSEDALIGMPVQRMCAIFETQGQTQVLIHLLALQQLMQVGQVTPSEMREALVEVKQQILNVRLTIAFNPYNRPNGIVISLRDITRQVQADRAKSDFVSTVSHELRTPMTSIKGYTELLRQGAVGPLNDNQQEFLNVVQRNISRLATLINDLLDVSRIEAGKIRLSLETIHLEEIAAQVVETFQMAAKERNLSLKLDVQPDLPGVQADWDRITQVLTNLVGNAITYTQQGSVTVSLQSIADAVQVSVKDSGVGISPEDMNHIFERFYRADHEYVQANAGTGLGLPIVQSIVDMHNGRIWVDSKLNHGSTFTFILPVDGGNPVTHLPVQ